MSSLWGEKKSLFRPSAHFLMGLFGFLMLSCVKSLYILGMNFRSNISFANIFSHSLLFVEKFLYYAEIFNLMQFHLYTFVLFPLPKETGI